MPKDYGFFSDLAEEFDNVVDNLCANHKLGKNEVIMLMKGFIEFNEKKQ